MAKTSAFDRPALAPALSPRCAALRAAAYQTLSATIHHRDTTVRNAVCEVIDDAIEERTVCLDKTLTACDTDRPPVRPMPRGQSRADGAITLMR
jgi:hypothetical protein